MKKLLCLLICGVICLSFSGCFSTKKRIKEDPEFARVDYTDDSKIAAGDRYDGGSSYTVKRKDRFYGTFQEFYGYRTIGEYSSDENKTITAELFIDMVKGKAKIVFVDAAFNVTTLYECENDEGDQIAKKFSVTVPKGENLFKLVGYDCEGLMVDLYFYDGEIV